MTTLCMEIMTDIGSVMFAPNDWAKLKAKAELFSRTEQKTYLAEIHFYARKRHGQRGYDLFELKITKILYEI